jgi:predicted aldo/keto reductase-like oxidoreductase
LTLSTTSSVEVEDQVQVQVQVQVCLPDGRERREHRRMANDFLVRDVPALKKPVFRLGLSGAFGLDEAGAREALETARYVFWTPMMKGLTRALREVVRRDREAYVVATGPLLGFTRGAVRRAAEHRLRALGVDYLDVYQLYWLSRMSAQTGAVEEELVRLREEGKIRVIGTSLHDRPRAGRLAEASIFDLLMIRYNAAHPGAEQEIFPHLVRRRPAIVAYTATSWRKLLKAPRAWSGRPMTAGECYRWVLGSPHVDVVLCGPKNAAEWRADLAAVQAGPLPEAEASWMRDFGRAVHG